MPDFLSVLTDGTVRGELAGGSDVPQALTAECHTVSVLGICLQLSLNVGGVVQQQVVLVVAALNQLLNGDQYYLMLDYASYVEAKLAANAEYADRETFGRKCLTNVASAAKFSSDRTIRQYAEEIWHIKPTQF